MKTELIKVDPLNPNKELLIPAAEALKRGELVCFPTETVYGLGAVWSDAEAVAEIFKVKGRPQDNPLIVHETSVERMKNYYASWDQVAEVLTKAFCPGPFTLIMKHHSSLRSPATAGLDTIAVRIPEHKVTRLLIEAAGEGLAAPSANISGRPSPTNALDALEDLNGKVPYIIDGGACGYGVESSIVSWNEGKLELLRPGGITAEDIERVLDEAGLDIPLFRAGSKLLPADQTPRAPGMKYRHYAPKAKVHILKGSGCREKLAALVLQLEAVSQEDFCWGLYISDELAEELASCLSADDLKKLHIRRFAGELSHAEAAKGLFAAFRSMDREGVSDIWAEELDTSLVGAAYMNRLLKAAAG